MARISFAERIKSLFVRRGFTDEAFFDDLTDSLIEGDIGAKTAVLLVDELKSECRKGKPCEKDDVVNKLKTMLLSCVKSLCIEPEEKKTNVWMVLGVNGVGKTTSIAKMARLFCNKGVPNITLAAADTFRAAAIDQIKIHGERLGLRVVSHQEGSDPGAVVFDASESVRAHGGGLVLADTAGRLHNKENLVRQLQKIDKIAKQKSDSGCYKKILVIDATTGQNALRQAEVFNESVGVDALVLTKSDSTAKGGTIVSICKELSIPVAFLCTGEKYDDISLFDKERYVSEFLGV